MKNSILKTKQKLALIMIITLSLTVIGSTYAYYFVKMNNNEELTGTAAEVHLALEVNRIFPETEKDNLVPQLYKEGSTNPLATALKRKCIDENDNLVCQLYKITITNDNGTITEEVNGGMTFYSDNNLSTDITNVMPNLSWRLVDSTSELGTHNYFRATSSLQNFAQNIKLTPNESKDYYVIIWINETENDQTDVGKSFFGNVEFNASNGIGVTASF